MEPKVRLFNTATPIAWQHDQVRAARTTAHEVRPKRSFCGFLTSPCALEDYTIADRRSVYQAFFWTFRKKLKAKKTQAENKLKQIFEKLKQIIQKLNNLPT